MKCPKCQSENPESAKFCVECGGKLEIICPKCNFSNSASFKFCAECGHNLTLPSEPSTKDLSFDEKLDKIQRYLPKGITEKILSQRDKIEGERKQVTVMFCDMEGFTQLSERLGPEEVYSMMDEIYEILIHKVHDYEGTVNEMTGDGIMALFGAPIALEDAPQRSIRSAMAIHREMARFSDKLKQEQKGIPPLKMRVGINTGPVVVGTLGNDLRVEFKAVGDTVNLASRMEELAEPGTSYVTEETFKLTEGFFRFEALGEKQVKGKEGPVKTYRVITPSTRRTRFDVSAERGLTAFVGRERELELLLDGFERTKGGRGQAFSIIAEAGVGKSRLLYEFRKAVANEDVTFLEGKCLSYSRGVAYHPVIDILKSNFDIQEGDGDLGIREKVKRGLKVLGVDEASTLPYLLELLSVKDSGIDKIPMSPEARKERIIEALNRIVLKGSEIRPLIMAIEDLHWIDKSSEDSFKDLLDSITGARAFLIFTYRPEFVHTWGGRSYHGQVNLNRLSNQESLTIVSHLLGTQDIDRDLEKLILEKTEGVPFFIEEFIRSLQDLKIIERQDNKYFLAKDIKDLTIPSTLQDVIMARVDSLSEGAKEVLQAGSVIEREFSYELIKKVKGLPEQELLSHLSALKNSELLYERGIYPETTYIFKHALTREVVYDSILTKKRKKLHEQIGQAIEEICGENAVDYYGVLAEHFFEGENYEKGAEYSKLAAKRVLNMASLNYAIAHTKRRVTSLERLPRTDEVKRKIIDARTTLGLYDVQMNYFAEAKEAIDPIIDLAVKQNYKKRLSQIYTILGISNYAFEDSFPDAVKHLGEALRISEEISDIVSFVLASYYLGVALCFDCEFERGFQYLEKSLNINVAANNLWATSLLKSSISCYCHFNHGKINSAYQTSKEAIQLAEKSADIYSKAFAYTAHGMSLYGKGHLEEAKENLLRGVNFCQRINEFLWNAMAEFYLGDTHFEMGEYEKSIDHFSKAVLLVEDARFAPSFLSWNKIGLAKAKVMNNEKDTDLESLYSYVYKNKVKVFDGWMRRYIGGILLNIDDQHMSEAEDWIEKAIEMDKRNGMMWHLSQDYSLYAELFKRIGDQSKAKENLNMAIGIYRECGADGWVKKNEKELAAL
jgi:class 3 adenylate cyclase/tetratricopeptide (TPR) repeat protein